MLNVTSALKFIFPSAHVGVLVVQNASIPVFQVAQKIWMLGTGASHADTIGIGWMTDRFLDSQMDILKAAYTRVIN